MKIRFFITSLGGGGAERVVCNLSNYLVEAPHSVTIDVLRGKDSVYQINDGVKVNYLQPNYYNGKTTLVCRMSEIWKVWKFLSKLKRQELLVSFLELPVAYSLIFYPLYKSKLIICERNNPEFYGKWYQRIFRRLSKNADGCVCQTKVIYDWYAKYIKEECLNKIIPNSINKEVSSAPIGKRNSKKIVTMARLTPQKNQKLLVSAFAEVSKTYPDYELEIYGEGPLKSDLESFAKESGVGDKVKLMGFTNNVIEVLGEAAMFVLTSEHEGMPNALAEAMAMGVPSISTDCGGGGARELIESGVNGVLVPRNDLNALTEAMKKVIGDKDFADKIANNGIKLRTTLSPDSIHKEWLNLFKSV